ncbi:MAG: hypothetical protein R3F60_04695 [bacterium]
MRLRDADPASAGGGAGRGHALGDHRLVRSGGRGPAEAHVALGLGDDTLWQATVPIPSAARVEAVEVALPASHPAGAPVVFHVHNHGANSWFITQVEVTPACAVVGGPYE